MRLYHPLGGVVTKGQVMEFCEETQCLVGGMKQGVINMPRTKRDPRECDTMKRRILLTKGYKVILHAVAGIAYRSATQN